MKSKRVHAYADPGYGQGPRQRLSSSCCGPFAPKQLTIFSIFRLYGSVLPRCIIQAILGGVAGGLMEYYEWSAVEHDVVWRHPYALHVFSLVLGFSLVMRIQIAYQRFWEGATQCALAAAKWTDACMQVFAFDEASPDAFEESGLEFRFLILHYASLMHACALIDMRQDDARGAAELTILREDPFLFRPNRSDAHNATSFKGGTDEEQSPTAEDKRNSSFLFSSAGKTSKPNLTGRSSRAHTVPLQMVLRSRSQMMEQHPNDKVNSFEAM